MLVIGLTGGIGCGKSTVAEMFARLGAAVIDTDRIAHQLTENGQPALAEIRTQLGDEYFLPDGNLDRPRLRNRVFSDPAAKERLERILHPRIRNEVMRCLSAVHGTYVLLVVPLLLETGAYQDVTARVLVVDCTESQQVARVLARSALTEADVRSIMDHQIGRQERLQLADDICDNQGDPSALGLQVEQLHRKYLMLSALP